MWAILNSNLLGGYHYNTPLNTQDRQKYIS